jgi:hypothetical protein
MQIIEPAMYKEYEVIHYCHALERASKLGRYRRHMYVNCEWVENKLRDRERERANRGDVLQELNERTAGGTGGGKEKSMWFVYLHCKWPAMREVSGTEPTPKLRRKVFASGLIR